MIRVPVRLQHSDAPVFPCPLSGRLKARQADEGHGGGDGQGADVLQQHPGQAQRADAHLDQGGDDDGALDLERRRHIGLTPERVNRRRVPHTPFFFGKHYFIWVSQHIM